jgi:hypothetical protein
MRLRQVRKNYDKWQDKANFLQAWVREEFEHDKMHEKLSKSICPPMSKEAIDWINKLETMGEL